MRLYRRDREIHLLHRGRAHTEGDVFVYLPKEYEKPFSAYATYRPWRAGLFGNVERTFAMVS